MRILLFGCLTVFLCPLEAAHRTTSPAAARPGTGTIASDVYERAIRALEGQLRNPLRYPRSLEGFQAYLADSGVESFTAEQMTKPNHPGLAAKLGFRYFLPDQSWWPRGAALALLADRLQTAAREPVSLRNWWRPEVYNRHPLVGGAAGGDHPSGHAIDLDYRSARGRMRAECALRGIARRFPWMQISLGLGEKTTHVGLGSPRGAREWHYAGWRPGTLG